MRTPNFAKINGMSNASYSFSGLPGTSTASASGIVTETMTFGKRTETITYTPVAGSPGVYQITSIAFAGHTMTISPSATSPTFAFTYNPATGGDTIVETIVSASHTQTMTYSATAAGFSLSSVYDAITNPTTATAHGGTDVYSFSATGAITETITQKGRSHVEAHPLNPTAVVGGLGTGTVTETYVSGNAVIAEVYTGSAANGYALAGRATSYIPVSDVGPKLDVEALNRADFDFTANTVTHISPQGVLGSPLAMNASKGISYTELGSAGGLAGDFVGETITHGSHSAFELFYSSTGVGGEYMQVAEGSGAASGVSLTNIAAEISSLNALTTFKT